MFSFKLIGFLCAVWIIGMLLAATFDAQSTTAETWGLEDETALEYLADIKKITYAENETGTFAWLTPNTQYFDAIGSIVTWRFSFLRCPEDNPGCGYAYFRLIVLVPITLAALFALTFMFITLLQGFIPGT